MKKGILLTAALAMVLGSLTAKAAAFQDPLEDEEDWGEYFEEFDETAYVQEANEALSDILSQREVMAVVYLTPGYEVRSAADFDSEVVVTAYSGQTVFIQSVALGNEGDIWDCVKFAMGSKEYTGYIERGNLAISDERFLDWEMEWGLGSLTGVSAFSMTLNGTENVSTYLELNQFPESYRAALDTLKQAHPNWIFVPLNTGLDWNTAVDNEMKGGRSLVYKTYPSFEKEGAYDDGNWFYASREVLSFYMDPRNSLNEEHIFQFEQLTFNESYHTEAALELFLNQTFMNSSANAPGTDMTFKTILFNVGKQESFRVSPFHLAARIYQEQGAGTSPLISGTYPGYENLYNYFNIGATGKTTEEVIVNGLTYAKNAKDVFQPDRIQPWNNAYYSILGGSYHISANYIRKGQDSLYLQKYNVNPTAANPLYTHQYMQNISAAYNEATKVKKMYLEANSLECPFVFTIPVYNNMPATACQRLTASNNVVLKVPTGFDNTTIYLDGVAYPAAVRNGYSIVTAPNAATTTAIAYQYNEKGVPVDMYVWTLEYKNGGYTATAQPGLQNLLSYHGFSIRITGKSGIRFKTGISTEVRQKLTTEGVAGYKLKEYGTLVMNKANMSAYPLIKGGAKVSSGMSYGMNAEGVLEDNIYETAADRYRFTSVLVGIPASQYKTEFAFRGYAVLEKDGKEIILYGPAVAKSIYALASQVLERGTYAEGSDAEVFLKQLIADADA